MISVLDKTKFAVFFEREELSPNHGTGFRKHRVNGVWSDVE